MRAREGDPEWLRMALFDVGVREAPGRPSNPRIFEYYRAAGLAPGDAAEPLLDDSTTPWCGCAMAYWFRRAGVTPTTRPARARSWLLLGRESDPVRGAVAVYSRGGNPQHGHVAILLRRRGDFDVIVGGNQGNSVSISTRPTSTALGYRWPVV